MATIQLKERQKEIAVKVGLGIGLLIVLFWGIILPALKESKRLRVEIQESQERLQLHQELTILKKDLATLEGPLNSLADRARLIGVISDIATQNEINVQSLTPKTTPSGDYVKLTIEMQDRAPFFSLVNFLKTMETREPSMSVKDATFLRNRGAERPGQKGVLQSQLVLETLLLKKKPAGTQA